jgi:hypothetical protein
MLKIVSVIARRGSLFHGHPDPLTFIDIDPKLSRYPYQALDIAFKNKHCKHSSRNI